MLLCSGVYCIIAEISCSIAHLEAHSADFGLYVDAQNMYAHTSTTWLSPIAIRLTYLAMPGVAVGRISDLSQPGCVKQLHILPLE